MDDPTEPSGSAPPAVRRRVVPTQEPESREGRTGCLIIGAVLGIAIGALFTFFALPPLLNHYFGEQHIGLGGTYRDSERQLTAVDPPRRDRVDPRLVDVQLLITATGDKPWAPSASNFELEYASGRSLVARTASVNLHSGHGGPPPGDVDLQFEFSEGDGAARYLHIKDLNARFELPQPPP